MATSLKLSDLTLYFRLLRYTKPYFISFGLSIFGYLLVAMSQPALANMMKFFIDTLSGKQAVLFKHIPYFNSLNLFFVVPILLVIIAIWQGVGSFIGGFFISKVSLGLVRDVRVDLFNKFQCLPAAYFDNRNSGSLASAIIYSANSITRAATNTIQVIIREGLISLCLLGYLFYMNWKLTLILAISFPVIIPVVIKTSKRFRNQSLNIQSAMGAVSHIASEASTNYKDIKIFGGKDYEKKRFEKATRRVYNQSLEMSKLDAFYTPKLQLILYTAITCLLFLVVFFRGDSTTGDVLAYITAAALLPKSIKQLTNVSSTIQKGLAGAEVIFGMLDEHTEIDNGVLEKKEIDGKLEIKHLKFHYPFESRYVLNEINFVIKPNQIVALVGKSGSGKTTLTQLILRLYDYSEGEILLDGIPIKQYTLNCLRKHIAIVSQQVSLFNDTIFKNIAYGELENASFEDVVKAAKAAHADEFINKLPDRYNTIIGDNGLLLSGGQRQRISIARAFLKNAKVLILDEAVSALDNESEFFIQTALNDIMKGRATLVIAHRLSTIKHADQIIVIHEGNIVEQGTHKELIQLNQVYANLYKW